MRVVPAHRVGYLSSRISAPLYPDYRVSAPVVPNMEVWHIRMFRHKYRNAVRQHKPKSWSMVFFVKARPKSKLAFLLTS